MDENRDIRYTNKYTISKLFPDESPVSALRRELSLLTVQNYIETVKDLTYPERSDMRVFGKVYNETDDVYIKIRVELLAQYGNHMIFVMSFHFAEMPFTQEMFIYRKQEVI